MRTGVEHEENFPVASWLCPPRLRPVIAAIYWFARTADDLADEGLASPLQRLSDLTAYRQQLEGVSHPGFSPTALDPRWHTVFEPLGRHIEQHRLPVHLLHDLLDAFEQDVRRTASGQRYAHHGELLDYCQRSANPVGRLLLHLYGVTDPVRLGQSDAICSALQLINFWQDLGVDLPRQRHYLTLADLQAHGLTASDFDAPLANPDKDARREALLAHLTSQAVDLMHQGAELPLSLPGRVGWELRLVVQGGLRTAERIRRMRHRTWLARPRLRAADAPLLLWRAWRMG